MLDLSTLKRCADISESHVIQAAKSRAAMRELLQHAAKISRPGEGAGKVLLALSRMAMSSSDWIDGDLRVDLRERGERTDVDVKSVSGGVIERVFPTFTLDAPLEELVRAAQLVPRMVEPLVMHQPSEGHVVLVSSEELYDELPPESVEIDEAENDFSSLNIEVAEAIPESEVEKPVLKGATRPALDPGDIHRRQTVQRMPAIGRDALRSDVPPPTTKARPKTAPPAPPPAEAPGSTKSKPESEGEPTRKDDDFDEGWE